MEPSTTQRVELFDTYIAIAKERGNALLEAIWDDQGQGCKEHYEALHGALERVVSEGDRRMYDTGTVGSKEQALAVSESRGLLLAVRALNAHHYLQEFLGDAAEGGARRARDTNGKLIDPSLDVVEHLLRDFTR